MEKIVPTRLIVRAVAAAIAIAPTPALAQSAYAQPVNFPPAQAKTEAILGGASRLASILAQQQGLPAPAALQPASLGARTPTYAVLRGAPTYSLGASSGKPDVFGSVALSVRRTPLDHRWRKVANSGVGGVAASYALSLRGADDVEKAEAINRYVNRRVQFVDDSRQYGRADMWTAAGDTLKRGRGDCEDYAIAKLQMLRAAGVSSRDLYLVIVKDLVRRADHAVLVVRASGRMLVLDNGTDTVADAETVRDYRPILTFASGGAWTHGYRRSLPTMTIASASIAPLVPSASAGRAD